MVEQERKAKRTRWLVELEGWDWSLGLGIARPDMPEEAKFHGELVYTQWIDIHARLVAPKAYAGRPIRVSLSPTRLQYWTGPDALGEVGQFNAYDEPRNGSDFGASILIPEDSQSGVLISLASVWRYIHIWTVDPLPRASINQVSFSRDLHPNLEPWIRGEGHADF